MRRPATVTSPAFDLSYVRSGPRTGTPIVVIPGGPGLAAVAPYRSLRRIAADGGLDLIMVEHRGIGRSRRDVDGHVLPQSAMRITDVVDDLAVVLEREGIDRAVIAGSSYGSYLASAFGARHPGLVAGMLLDSTLQSAHDIDIERRAIRAQFWDAGDEISSRVRQLASSGVEDRALLDVVRAAYELGGDRLLSPVLDARLRHRLSPAWAALQLYARRDESLIEIPRHYEFAVAGTIGFRELGYGGTPDGLPLDPAHTYAAIAGRFPPFSGEAFDLHASAAGFEWPLALIVGDRDLRTPPEIAERVAEAAPRAVITRIKNGHSALDTHPIAFLNAARLLARGAYEQLPRLGDRLSALPRRGAAEQFRRALTALARTEARL